MIYMSIPVVYGFPSTGKTTAAGALRSVGIKVLDTDDLIGDKPYNEEAIGEIGRQAGAIALAGEADIIVTNLWSDSLFDALGVTRFNSAFIRKPKLALELLQKRGENGHDLGMVSQWYADIRHSGSSRFPFLVELGEDEYITGFDLLNAMNCHRPYVRRLDS